MPLTFILLNSVNAALAAASLWIHFRIPGLWDDQALVYSTLAGFSLACLSAILLGARMLFSDHAGWRSHLIHLTLILAFAAVQGYLLYLLGKDLGLPQLLKSRMG
jgi:hypothetical protein